MSLWLWFWIPFLCVSFFFAGAHFGIYVQKQRLIDPHFLGATEFKYNMTKHMQDETKLLDFCISNTTIKIPDVEKFCALSYGGLNTTYGDQIK